ncbi:MAG TPA: molybdate ABC transporter substrate-binding protein [Methylococcaceae bacterium]|nr:molybdate ABC transporter substrate-binding protein [Methylococcaceae bacterium]
MLRKLFFAVVLWLAAFGAGYAGEPPVIAAAADLKFALTEIAARFKGETGVPVNLTFGSSGNFYRQIQQGAPFELFLSADENYVAQLAKEGKTDGEGILYGIGEIVLYTSTKSHLKVDKALADLRQALTEGRVKHFAIANPEHAPYGRAARQALEHQGLWGKVAPVVVLGENVAQAAQFVTSGAADGGIIAYSLALSPELRTAGTYVLLPPSWHEPIRQRMVLLKNAGPDARKFYDYLQQATSRKILERYGFTVP